MQLNDPLVKILRLTEVQKKALKKLHLTSVADVLYHFPARYVSSTGDMASVVGVISKTKARKAWKSRIPMTEATLKDESGSLHLLWLHQPYISKMFPEGSAVVVTGKIKEKNGKRSMINPEITRADKNATLTGKSLFGATSEHPDVPLFPVYPESRGITSRWFFYTIQKILADDVVSTAHDPIPKDILKKYNLPALGTALVWMHAPKNEADARAARKRFAFQEIFFIQLKKQQERHFTDSLPTWDIRPSQESITGFLAKFPFTPTSAQSKALTDIFSDFAGTRAMSRLLEGDVGSGKTFVAAATSFAVVTTRPPKMVSIGPALPKKSDLQKQPKHVEGKQDFGNLQVALMAPTEILATQHFESFIDLYRGLPINVALITSSGCKKFPSKVKPNSWTDISRPQLLKWVANGEIPILIGTHALIQKTVEFKHLAYVIIDEQHRFGTKQRMTLARKDEKIPHLLSMTATPIPRTLALTIYGDLDLTLLDVMPPGRKPIITTIATPRERKAVYEHIRTEVQSGRQAYIICPRIDAPDENDEMALQAKSVEEETKHLSHDVFPEFHIASLHGKMLSSKKESVMADFVSGAINILVATSVVEVGVNVPNATIIIIEGAERFGLSQLHQIRGRVLRSTHQAHCYLFTESKSQSTLDRLKVLAKAANGFELAEHDLALRGAGGLVGHKQWGVSDVGMEALQNIKMVEAARNEAKALVSCDPELSKFPLLRSALTERETLHFE